MFLGKFQKKLILLSILLLITSLAVVKEGRTEKVILRFGLVNAPGHFLVTSAEKFGEIIAKKTNNQVEVKVYPSSQLGGEMQLAEGIKIGTVDMAVVSAGVLYHFEPMLGIWELPYVFRDYDHVFKAHDGGSVVEEVSRRALKVGIRVLGYWDNGFRYVFTRERPIREIGDFKGLKIRVPEAPIYIDTFRLLGAKPTPVPFPELYTALQTKVVDGYEGNPTSCYIQKFYEVTKYISPTKHLFISAGLLISEKTFQKLSPDTQKIVEEAAREATLFERQIGSQPSDKEYLRKLIEEKGLILSDIDSEPLRKAVDPIYESFGKKIGGKVWIEKLMEIK